MKKILFLLALINLCFACGDDSPTIDEAPIEYPLVFQQEGYSFEATNYYLMGENQMYTSITPSAPFQAHMDYLETHELPEIYEEAYALHTFELLSESTAKLINYDPLDMVYDTSLVNYITTASEITFSDTDNLYSITFDYDAANGTITYRDIGMVKTEENPLNGMHQYSGIGLEPSYIFQNTDDLLQGYLDLYPEELIQGDSFATIVVKLSYGN